MPSINDAALYDSDAAANVELNEERRFKRYNTVFILIPHDSHLEALILKYI
jgi:hypothetical protein